MPVLVSEIVTMRDWPERESQNRKLGSAGLTFGENSGRMSMLTLLLALDR
jgi:hypothetical protein